MISTHTRIGRTDVRVIYGTRVLLLVSGSTNTPAKMVADALREVANAVEFGRVDIQRGQSVMEFRLNAEVVTL